MDKAVEAVFKVFSHLARDIQTYIFAGSILIGNYYLLDQEYLNGSTTSLVIDSEYLIYILIVASYVLGQVCLGFYTLVEITPLEKWLHKIIPSSGTINTDAGNLLEQKVKALNNNKENYMHFVERSNNLSTLRWNYSSAFMICTLMDICFILFYRYEATTAINAIISFLIAVLLMILYVITQRECIEQASVLAHQKKTEQKAKAGLPAQKAGQPVE